jgi:4a-hydroxytetrahydrobiopterin dehydratase
VDLSKKKCIPCEAGTPPLGKDEIAKFKKAIQGDWKITKDNKITREYFYVNYKHTMVFVNKVADMAEEEGHHPVMCVYYGRVVIELWTHAIKGLSENDFILAAKIDKL